MIDMAAPSPPAKAPPAKAPPAEAPPGGATLAGHPAMTQIPGLVSAPAAESSTAGSMGGTPAAKTPSGGTAAGGGTIVQTPTATATSQTATAAKPAAQVAAAAPVPANLSVSKSASGGVAVYDASTGTAYYGPTVQAALGQSGAPAASNTTIAALTASLAQPTVAAPSIASTAAPKALAQSTASSATLTPAQAKAVADFAEYGSVSALPGGLAEANDFYSVQALLGNTVPLNEGNANQPLTLGQINTMQSLKANPPTLYNPATPITASDIKFTPAQDGKGAGGYLIASSAGQYSYIKASSADDVAAALNSAGGGSYEYLGAYSPAVASYVAKNGDPFSYNEFGQQTFMGQPYQPQGSTAWQGGGSAAPVVPANAAKVSLQDFNTAAGQAQSFESSVKGYSTLSPTQYSDMLATAEGNGQITPLAASISAIRQAVASGRVTHDQALGALSALSYGIYIPVSALVSMSLQDIDDLIMSNLQAAPSTAQAGQKPSILTSQDLLDLAARGELPTNIMQTANMTPSAPAVNATANAPVGTITLPGGLEVPSAQMPQTMGQIQMQQPGAIQLFNTAAGPASLTSPAQTTIVSAPTRIGGTPMLMINAQSLYNSLVQLGLDEQAAYNIIAPVASNTAKAIESGVQSAYSAGPVKTAEYLLSIPAKLASGAYDTVAEQAKLVFDYISSAFPAGAPTPINAYTPLTQSTTTFNPVQQAIAIANTINAKIAAGKNLNAFEQTYFNYLQRTYPYTTSQGYLNALNATASFYALQAGNLGRNQTGNLTRISSNLPLSYSGLSDITRMQFPTIAGANTTSLNSSAINALSRIFNTFAYKNSGEKAAALQYLSESLKPTMSTETALSRQLHVPSNPAEVQRLQEQGTIIAAMVATPILLEEALPYLASENVLASMKSHINVVAGVNVLSTIFGDLLQGKLPSWKQLGGAAASGAEAGLVVGAVAPALAMGAITLPSMNALEYGEAGYAADLRAATGIIPKFIEMGVTKIPAVVNMAIDFANLMAALQVTNSTARGVMPTSESVEFAWAQGAVFGAIFGSLAPVVNLAPEGVSRSLANVLSGASGSILGTNLISLAQADQLSSPSQDLLNGVIGAAFAALMPAVIDIPEKLSPIDIERASYAENPYTKGTSSYKILLKVPDIVQDAANLFKNGDISNPKLEALYTDLQAKNGGVKPTTEQVMQALIDDPSLLDVHDLPTNPFRYQITLASLTLGPRLVPGLEMFPEHGDLSSLNRVMADAVMGAKVEGERAIGGSTGLQGQMPTGASRTPGDEDIEFTNKAELEALANIVGDAVKGYYSKSDSKSGLDPARVSVKEGKGAPGTTGEQYHVIDTDPTTGKETKLSDINYQAKIPHIMTIDGINFVDYKDILADKLSILKEGSRPEVMTKSKTDVELIQKAEQEYGVGKIAVSSPLGLRLDLGVPNVPGTYYVPERNIAEIVTNRPLPDSIFKNPSDVRTFQAALDREAAAKDANPSLSNTHLETDRFRILTDLAYTIKNSNLAPLKALNIDIEGHPQESQAVHDVLSDPEFQGKIVIEGSNVGSIAFRDFRGSGDVDTVSLGHDSSEIAERATHAIADKANELLGRDAYHVIDEKDGSFSVKGDDGQGEKEFKITTMHPRGAVSAAEEEYNEEFRNPVGMKETEKYMKAKGALALEPSELAERKIATSIAPRQFTEEGLPKKDGTTSISSTLEPVVKYLRKSVGEGGLFTGSLGRISDTGDKLFPNKDVGDTYVLLLDLSVRYYGGALNDKILQTAKMDVTRGFITQEGYDFLAKSTMPTALLALEDRMSITADDVNGFIQATKDNVVTPAEQAKVITAQQPVLPMMAPARAETTYEALTAKMQGGNPPLNPPITAISTKVQVPSSMRNYGYSAIPESRAYAYPNAGYQTAYIGVPMGYGQRPSAYPQYANAGYPSQYAQGYVAQGAYPGSYSYTSPSGYAYPSRAGYGSYAGSYPSRYAYQQPSTQYPSNYPARYGYPLLYPYYPSPPPKKISPTPPPYLWQILPTVRPQLPRLRAEQIGQRPIYAASVSSLLFPSLNAIASQTYNPLLAATFLRPIPTAENPTVQQPLATVQTRAQTSALPVSTVQAPAAPITNAVQTPAVATPAAQAPIAALSTAAQLAAQANAMNAMGAVPTAGTATASPATASSAALQAPLDMPTSGTETANELNLASALNQVQAAGAIAGNTQTGQYYGLLGSALQKQQAQNTLADIARNQQNAYYLQSIFQALANSGMSPQQIQQMLQAQYSFANAPFYSATPAPQMVPPAAPSTDQKRAAMGTGMQTPTMELQSAAQAPAIQQQAIPAVSLANLNPSSFATASPYAVLSQSMQSSPVVQNLEMLAESPMRLAA